ncbi:unnamed protein product [Ambrosiozyma monospora]|uniref:Unnamed protein product n=1 Tax=Ambrosiozyma monospora TaxID=43982 RepID=A0A9W6YWZ9_AMBMO|nr:unnamed protein product [Ambrosiozyma monospora]
MQHKHTTGEDLESASADASLPSNTEKVPLHTTTSVSMHGFDELRNLDENQKKNIQGLELFDEARDISYEEIEAMNSKIVRKLDLHIIPILCVTYLLQFLDKLSLNYAAAYSFKEDLGLTGQRYSWVAAIFNFGYLAGSIPANYLIQKYPVAKFTGIAIFIWSILLLGHIGATNYGGILVLRFLLGLCEAGISPSCMNINAAFYKKSEQPLRMCIFLSFNGVATMVGALLSFGLGHATHAAIKPWKLIFLTIGLLNFCWSIIFTWFCPSTPADARFLNEKEKAIAVERVAHNYQGLKNDKLQFYQIREAAMDLHCWFYALVGMGVGVVNGGSSNFQSALLKGFGFSGISTTILQLPTGAIEWVVVTAAGIIAISFKNTRSILLFLTCVPGTAGLIGIHVIPLSHKWALVGCTWLQYIVGGPVILSWILLNANVAGQTKRTITNEVVSLVY